MLSIKFLFVLTFLLLLKGTLSASVFETSSNDDFRCTGFTFDKCDLDIEGILAVVEDVALEICQTYCNMIYPGECQMFHYIIKENKCNLLRQTVEDHVRTCNQMAGPKEPKVDDCLASTDPCNFYHDEDCTYQGKQIGDLQNIASPMICQFSCILNSQCFYFLYDFDVKDCKLYNDGAKDCLITVGPSSPSFEECSVSTPTSPPTETTETTTPYPTPTETTTPYSPTTEPTTTPYPTTTEPTIPSTTPTIPPIPGICTTPSYPKLDGHCACGFFIDEKVTWLEALEVCKRDGARLPEIMSAEENAFIYNMSSLIWLGANDFLSEGQFVWESTGSPVQSYLNWNINEPNNLGGDEGCMHFHSSAKGQWNDLSCESFLPTMCEILYTCS